MKKKKSNHKEKMPNRDQLIKLLKEYNELYSVKNKLKRIRKNPFAISIIIIFIPIIIAFVIGIVSLIFFREYIDDLKILCLIVISITSVGILIKINWENLENYYPKKLKIRDEEIIELLEETQIDIKKIKKTIEYFKLDIEYEKLLDNGTPVINTVSQFWHELFFLIFGVVITNLYQKEFEQKIFNELLGIMIVVLVTGVLILGLRMWNYFEKKNSYFNRIQKLVLDLKRIDLLYYHK